MLRWHRSRASRQDHLLHPAAIPVRPLGNKVTAEVGPGPNAGQARHIDRAEMLSQAPAYGPPMEVELTIRPFGCYRGGIAARTEPCTTRVPAPAHAALGWWMHRNLGPRPALGEDPCRAQSFECSPDRRHGAASIVRVPVPDCARFGRRPRRHR